MEVTTNHKAFARWLTPLMRQRGETFDSLSEKTGYPVSSLRRWHNGDYLPSQPAAAWIGDVLEAPVAFSHYADCRPKENAHKKVKEARAKFYAEARAVPTALDLYGELTTTARKLYDFAVSPDTLDMEAVLTWLKEKAPTLTESEKWSVVEALGS